MSDVMNYILTDELARKWNLSPTRIRVMAKNGQIVGAKLVGKTWTFPIDVKKPVDGRKKDSKLQHYDAPFSFPLYLLKRIDESSLNEEQRRYINYERLLQNLDFNEAYDGFLEIASTTQNLSLLAGCYYYLSQISSMLEKYEDCFLYCRKLSALLNKDIPHQKDLVFLLWELRVFTHDHTFIIPSFENIDEFHPTCAPEMMMIQSYIALLHSLKTGNSINTSPYEINALVLNGEDYPLTNVYLHLHLGIMWSLNKNLDMKCKHLRIALDVALKHNLYYAVINYLNFFVDVLPKITSFYPEEVIEKMLKANSKFTHSDQEIIRRATKVSIPFLSQDDHAYMTYLLEGFNTEKVAKIKGISEKTVYKHYMELRHKFNAKNKKELLEKYRLFLMN